jgi:predicted secreted protein
VTEIRISPSAGDAGAAADVRVGDVLAVDVPENRTTGYVWGVAAVPEMLVELPSDPAVAGDEPPRPGAAGRRVLRFAAEQPGDGELRLRRARPWESAGGDELTVTVHVDPAG